jgi:hypothetical protein
MPDSQLIGSILVSTPAEPGKSRTFHGPFLHRAFHPTRGGWRNLKESKRTLDGSDRPQPDPLRKRILEEKSIPHS